MGLHHGQANFVTYGKPSLFLDFANKKSLVDRISGNNLITFTRSSTGTYVGADGLIKTAAADEARFDHDPTTGESLGLLIEEARTNIHTYSIPDSNWTQSNCTLTLNNTIAPDNTQTASLFTGTGGSSVGHYIYLNHPTVAGTFYTQTFFVKAGTTEFVQIATSTGWPSRYANFQLTGDGVVGNEDIVGPVTIEKYPNGWYRIRVTEEAINTYAGNSARMILSSVDSLTASRIPQSSEKTFYVWGAQLEQASFPTSYIPTSGSTVTRQVDYPRITGTNFSNFYNQTEGTFVSSWRRESNQPNAVAISVDDGTNSNRIEMRATGGDPSKFRFTSIINVTLSVNMISFSNNGLGNLDRISYAYSNNDYAFSANSSNVDTQTAGVPSVNQMGFGNSRYNIQYTGYINKLVYYPTRLTNTQLQSLTQ